MTRRNPRTPPSLLTAPFFHGTHSDAAAAGILHDGLRPWSDVAPEKYMRRGIRYAEPQVGRVYLSPYIDYALIYALGGCLAGIDQATTSRPVTGYGYVFAVYGRDLGDVQPDEDSVGEALRAATQPEPHWWPRSKAHAHHARQTFEFSADVRADPVASGWLRSAVARLITPKQRAGLVGGEHRMLITAGKRALKKMPLDIRLRLMTHGASLASAGPVMPRAAWRVDRSQCGLYEPDGSNFFQVATRIL